MFWADEIIEDIIVKIKKDSYLITDWKTPSGHIHVGALRGVIIHDLVCRGLKAKDKKTAFQYGFDDFDPMDGLPIYVDQSFKKYMGMPLNKVPAPDGKSKNYADQFLKEFQKVFNKLGIEPKIALSSEMYQKGEFNEAIKIILDHAQDIRRIYKEISGSDKGDDWFPFQVVCPKCGKIGTTKVTDWNGKEVTFQCEKELVKWAEGCGHQGSISPFDGNGKLPWKVEWPAKWYITKTDIEGEGKDHFAAGGSRDVADTIFRKIFQKTPPFDIRYEHILVSGAKMSSSKGLGVTAFDMADFLLANIIRFLFTRTRYKRAIDFQPEGDTIPILYDEYDRAIEAFIKDPKSDLGRAYYYTNTGSQTPPQYLLRFSKIAYMLQMPRADIFEYAKKEKGSDLIEIEKQEIENRIEIARKWLEKFAPESFKFKVLDNLPKDLKLSKIQKEFLQKISDIIKTKDAWQGEDLHQEIHNLKKEMEIPPREAFSAIYLIFIGKDSGPQAGWLLASLDKNFVIKRLKEAVE